MPRNYTRKSIQGIYTRIYKYTRKYTNYTRKSGPDGRCFLAAWAVSKSVHCCLNDRPKPNLPKQKVSTHSDVQCGSANRQTSFSGWGNIRIKLPFSGHIANKFRRPTILQLNIEGFTASKMNVLHHLAMQSEALVILLQETHCTDAEKVVLPNYQLAGSSLSRKHGLVCPRATEIHAFGPISTDIRDRVVVCGR